MFCEIAELGLGSGSITIRHPAHRSKGGEWDGLARLPARELRALTGARILTPHGLPPDVAAGHVGARLGIEMTPCELADWLHRVCVPALAERRRERDRAARQRYALEQGAHSYYDLRDGYAVIEGYRSLWDRRRAVWAS